MLLNVLGGITSGIWLAFLGEWKLLGTGVAAMFLGGIAVIPALMPGMVFTLPGVYFMERNWNLPGYFFLLLSTLYTVSIMVVWCVGVLVFFMSRATAETYIPLLIWSYGIGVSVWSWLAKKDGSDASVISSFFAQIGYVVMMGVVLVSNRVTVIDLVFTFGGVMLIAVIANFSITVALQGYARLHD